ncbi:Hypothetical predicted protein, partial [Pelobates cultripes]
IYPESKLPNIHIWLQWAPEMLTKPIDAYASIPSLQYQTQDLALERWIERGVTTLSHLVREGGLWQFPELQQMYLLPGMELFTYLHIKHILRDIAVPAGDTQKLHALDTMCLGQQTPAKPLSLFYQRLLGMDRLAKFRHMQWEEELKCTIEPSRWLAAMTLVKKATHCLDHVEAAYKLWMR